MSVRSAPHDPHRDIHSDAGAVAGEHPGRSSNPVIKVRGLAWLEFSKPDLVRAEPELVARHFPVDMTRQGIFGHSMGGHGAITLALKNPDRYASVSAFAPIAQPSTAGWSRPAFEKYLGPDERSWRAYDATLLIADGYRVKDLLVDQGTADGFLEEGLRPQLLEIACAAAGIPLELQMREGYDHSYNFISTFMAQHIAWHAERLAKG